jgi:hypothetical protein
MEEDKILNKVFCMDLETTKLKGRPRNMWKGEVKEDGKQAAGKEWKERLYKREEWKKLLRMARNCHILHM